MSDYKNEDFIEFNEFVDELASIDSYIDRQIDQQIIAMQVEKIKTETACQLSIEVDADGTVNIGAIPPIYYLETSFMPVFHNIKINFELEEN